MRHGFTDDARAAVSGAEREARAAGSRSVEAEHLLLAVSPYVGLDRALIAAALEAEWRAALDAADVHVAPPAPVATRGKLPFGTSAKQSLARALRIAKGRDARQIDARALALGVISADAGTVPRALRLAAIDTAALWDA